MGSTEPLPVRRVAYKSWVAGRKARAGSQKGAGQASMQEGDVLTFQDV